MTNDIFMADGACNQSEKGSASKCCPWSAAATVGACRSSSPTVPRVRSIRASSISLPGESLPARSPRRRSRGQYTGHFEASTTYGGTAPKICKKQWPDYWSNRNRRVEHLSAYSKKAWLSRIEKAADFESIFPTHLIACSRRSSRGLTRFWSRVANAPSACA
jgi:hypothetical protein